MTTTAHRPGPEGKPPAPAPRTTRPAALAAARCVSRLQRGYRENNSAAVGEVARLRRGAGRTAHEVQDHWGVGGLEELAAVLAEDGPSVRREDAEEAVYLAVTLWALHQQSVRDSNMHDTGSTLGGAVRALIEKKGVTGSEEGTADSLRKRLVRVGTADSIGSVSLRLREIVLLLRGERVPLNYGRLADQLYRWQKRSNRAAVRREWGREFHLAAPRRKGGPSTGRGGDDTIDPYLSPDEPDDEYGSGE